MQVHGSSPADGRAQASAAAAVAALRRTAWVMAVAGSLGLAGCEKLGLGSQPQERSREAEGRAIGGGCRHAGRAIEDCFALNRQADKAAVFAGWREMNEYMTKNSVPTASNRAEAKAGKASGTDAEPAAGPASGSSN